MFLSHPIPRLASYLPVRNEIDPNGFKLILGKRAPLIYLPRLTGTALEFVLWNARTPMGTNAFGIPEPLEGPVLAAEACPCMLLPLVAFDPYGRRIGSGGGYYDRTLAFRMESKPARFLPPLLIGVAYDCQRIDRIDPNPWDVPLDAVATDRCWYRGGETFPELTWDQLTTP
ncbi:5-formyltetrahydrofolate cyclo-ligase [mine drainage metagenome]|uniref:5-formyltetrahydrofolate cyclo-ligase n=1 Tax=mine drainage metagenome TaxID=410659 RepID=T0Z433_9ZZZZ